MNDLVKNWLTHLYEDEISEVLGTISNEKIWLLGSAEEDEIEMHTNNISSLRNYMRVLQDLLANIESI